MSEVYKAINSVQKDLSVMGIEKNRQNSQSGAGGYFFRGIDDVYNALAPLLSKHGLCILPRVLARTCEERKSIQGKPLFYVTVEAEFDFVAASDGSKHTVKTFGEAMDSSDKATNKAMSAAYKYAAFQAFSIPTCGDNDGDAHTPEPKARVLTPQSGRMWEKAKAVYKRDGTLDNVLKFVDISAEHQEQLINEVKNENYT